MIVELFLEVAVSVMTFMLNALPSIAVPAWMTSGPGQVQQVMGYVWAFDDWVPISLAGTVILTVLAAMAVGFSIKVGRIVLSFFTAGGGSAG